MNEKQQLEERKNRIENWYNKMNIKNFILHKIEWAEQRSYDPYYDYNEETSIKEEFNCNIYEEYKDCKRMMLEELKEIEEKINEIELIESIKEWTEFEEDNSEEIEDDDLKYVINLQLRKNYIKIEKTMGGYPEHQVWVYKNFFGLDINNQEELERAEREGIFREMIGW